MGRKGFHEARDGETPVRQEGKEGPVPGLGSLDPGSGAEITPLPVGGVDGCGVVPRAIPGDQILRQGVARPGQQPQEKEPPKRRTKRAVSAKIGWRQWERGHDLHLHLRGASAVILRYRSHFDKGARCGDDEVPLPTR